MFDNLKRLMSRADKEYDSSVNLLIQSLETLGLTPKPEEETLIVESCRQGNDRACRYLKKLYPRQKLDSLLNRSEEEIKKDSVNNTLKKVDRYLDDLTDKYKL